MSDSITELDDLNERNSDSQVTTNSSQNQKQEVDSEYIKVSIPLSDHPII